MYTPMRASALAGTSSTGTPSRRRELVLQLRQKQQMPIGPSKSTRGRDRSPSSARRGHRSRTRRAGHGVARRRSGSIARNSAESHPASSWLRRSRPPRSENTIATGFRTATPAPRPAPAPARSQPSGPRPGTSPGSRADRPAARQGWLQICTSPIAIPIRVGLRASRPSPSARSRPRRAGWWRCRADAAASCSACPHAPHSPAAPLAHRQPLEPRRAPVTRHVAHRLRPRGWPAGDRAAG